MITEIDFNSIYPVWKDFLWPTRTSKIETNSAMIYLGGIDISNMSYCPTFFAYIVNNKIYGVNSGHKCKDQSYRSRGLYVFPEHRKNGIGSKLLLAVIAQAKKENCKFIWSYPKQSSWTSYQKVGFSLTSVWETSEMDINAYCMRNL